jgi:hypothetical protein
MRSNLIEITVFLIHETTGAILVSVDEEREGVWLPKSQVELELAGTRAPKGKQLWVVTLSERLATEKGLI